MRLPIRLPDKKICHVVHVGMEETSYCPICEQTMGYNQAISDAQKLNDVELVCDKEKIQELVDKLNWVNSIERNRKFAQAISQNLSSIVTVKKGE